jgi:putative transposase
VVTKVASITKTLLNAKTEAEIATIRVELSGAVLDLQSKVSEMQTRYSQALELNESLKNELARQKKWEEQAARYSLKEMGVGILAYRINEAGFLNSAYSPLGGSSFLSLRPNAFSSKYLVAVMDWHTRAVLSWKLSNTLDTAFCLEALKEAVATAGTAPEIFNTDQGCQFTSNDWISAVEGMGTKASMDGCGRWLDNVFIERLWRSLKCERLYLSSYRNLVELEAGIAEWMRDYNHHRIHQALGYAIPWELYRPDSGLAQAA